MCFTPGGVSGIVAMSSKSSPKGMISSGGTSVTTARSSGTCMREWRCKCRADHEGREFPRGRADLALERVDEQAGPQLRFEPGAFWRHDLAGIGNIHELRERHREHRERDATVGL